MTKKRKSKKTKNKLASDSISTKSRKSDKSEIKKSRAKTFFSVVINFLAIWGVFLSTWVAFNPRIFVHPSDALDPQKPSSTPFIVHNQGYLAIHDVKFSCSIKHLKLPGDIAVIGLGEYSNRFSSPKRVASVIAPGEQYSETLPFSGMKIGTFENADIAIVLTFKPINWLPWTRETLHRFVATQGKDKKWHWLPEPINQ